MTGPALPATATLERLATSFLAGRTRPLSWRLDQLDGLEGLLARESGAIEEALAADLGRPPMEAFLADVYGTRQEVQALRRGLPRWSRPVRARTPLVLQPGRSRLFREPLGTVLVVGTWNYPVNLVLCPAAAALAAGNCVVLKPSEVAPATSALLADLVPRYLDPEAVAVLEGGPAVTEALIDGGVDHLFFTGSAPVGRIVMERAAKHLTPVTLELGGKSPVVLDERVDLEVAARRIAWGKLLNAGQSCIAPDYVLVPRRLADDLLGALDRAITALYGRDPSTSASFARIVNEAHLDRLGRLLAGHGGTVVRGGEVDRASRYLAPTVVWSPSPSSALMEEEIFGPVLPVLPVDGLAEAAAFLAARPVPLALYFFGEDREAAERFLAGSRSGTACVNTTMHQFASSSLPFGGLAASGTGRYHGRFGYEALSHLRPVLAKPARPDLTFAYPPFAGWKERLVRRALTPPFRRGRPPDRRWPDQAPPDQAGRPPGGDRGDPSE